MASYFRGTLWMIFILSMLPLLTCDMSCNSSCLCNSNGVVKCDGYIITDIPKELPRHTYTLLLNDTNMNIINEQSLSDRELLLRFSLTHSHLHTIHPLAFHVAPQLKSVKLSFNDLSTLPARVFSPLTALEEIYLDGNKLETLAPDMFEGLEGLLVLDLTRNKLTNPASDIFDGLTNLTILNLGRNYIKKLSPTTFHSLTKLRLLRIYNNELEELEEGIFDTLVNLEELNLHQNQIKSLPTQVFWSLENLKNLTLSSNQLQALPQKTFYNMPKLSKLTIYKNPLLSLPDELMGHMPDITEFYLFSTNLVTVPGNVFANMSGLLLLNLHLNDKLKELPLDLFCCLPNLQKLSLRNNNIELLQPKIFSSLTTLRILLLNDNKLKNLPEDIFENLTGIVAIDLRNNNLMTLPGDIFLSNTHLKDLTLSENPWDCTCGIRDIARWIRYNEQVVLDRDNVECHSPVYQLLRRVGSLSDEDFNYCNAKTFKTSFATQTNLPEPTQTLHVTSTSPPVASTTFDPTTLAAVLHTESTTQPDETHPTSLPFHDILVLEHGPEYVHHSHHKGWVYVWFLPSNTALIGVFMFGYILLLATGFLLILAAIFGMYRLSVSMDKLKTECAQTEE
ncbi:platelet glycoprotein V [Melanotaenia boesemani]|uniref:platelet glycoprotein V n=1 Tax=Melanotaenia boesemani TaxID=1250792 RepID=UPI001C03F3EF|nr:platelet glycoprotein V [Melanotaenia boesemani]